MKKSNTMKAVRIEATGDYLVLKYDDYAMPQMGDTDIMVKVMSTSLQLTTT